MRGSRDKSGDKIARFSLGDYVVANAPNPLARWYFLYAVEQAVPDAIKELRRIRARCVLRAAKAVLGEAAATRDADPLDVWAIKWGFTDPWAREAAEQWMDRGYATGSWWGWEPVFPPGPSWNPISETAAAFRIRVKAYIAAVKRTKNIQRAPKKQTPEHFIWLALHHVGGWTYKEIAADLMDQDRSDREDISDAAISEAIKNLAKMIGLTLRPARGRKSSRRVRRTA